MREQSAGTMLGLSGMLLAGLLVVAGCNSTAALPSTMARDPVADAYAGLPAPPAAETTWKKTPAQPSTALGQDQWQKPDQRDESIQKTTFEPQSVQTVEIPPMPEVMFKDGADTRRLVSASPASLQKHHGPALAMALPGAPSEWNLVSHPAYVLRPPDVLLIESQKGLLTQPVRGQHLVRVDGTVGLGVYGPAPVAGKTIQQAREEIARVIHGKLDPEGAVKYKDVLDGLNVDVLAYNSSVYYIITDGAGLGEQVYRFPVTGNETVLDAIANINGLPVVAAPKRIWVARRNTDPGHDNILPVDWKGITQYGAMNTNWQIMPGDRLYVQADSMRRFNNNFGKFMEPIERLMGATLLGANAYSTIKTGQPSTGR